MMNRRDVLAAAIGSGASTMLPSPSHAAVKMDAGDERLFAIIGRDFGAYYADNLQSATNFGQDIGANAALRHRLNDRSPAAFMRQLSRTKRIIAAVEAVDPRTLPPWAGSYREIYLYNENQDAHAMERFGVASAMDPFIIAPQAGAYITVPEFLNTQHKIRTAEDAEAYLDRVSAFATALDQDSERQAAQAGRGHLPPAFVLDAVLAQIAALRATAGMDNILTRSIMRRTAGSIPGDWGTRCATVVERDVYPALDRQSALMRRLRADARTSAGVWDMPDGEALYAAALEKATSTKSDPAALHQLGLQQMAAIGAQLSALLDAESLTRGTVGERLLQLSSRPELLYPDTPAGRAEILHDANALTQAIRSKLHGLFADLPDVPLRIEAATAEVEDGASYGNYFAAPINGSAPARFRINLKALAGSPRFALPAFAYHEGLPGHHLQKCYAREASGFRFTAFSEGWAMYAEQIADELGGYATRLDRIGYLQSRLFRAARLVVDTGIHARRWSREQATAYLVQETGTQPSLSQREIDRYCTRPGQACSYMVSYLTWARLLDGARATLGKGYPVTMPADVLRGGEVPLSVMERFVADRVRALARPSPSLVSRKRR